MSIRSLRRWIALCGVLALALGLAGQGFAAAEMDARMTAAAAAGGMAPSSDECGGCDDEEGMSAAACYALCGGTIAILPMVAPLGTVAVERPITGAARSGSGLGGAPDPHPPRPSVPS